MNYGNKGWVLGEVLFFCKLTILESNSEIVKSSMSCSFFNLPGLPALAHFDPKGSIVDKQIFQYNNTSVDFFSRNAAKSATF